MTEPTEKLPAESDSEGGAKKQPVANQPTAERIVDPRDLVYISSFSEDEGSISDDPREIINNPAVAPQTLDTTPENLRDDFFKDDSAS